MGLSVIDSNPEVRRLRNEGWEFKGYYATSVILAKDGERKLVDLQGEHLVDYSVDGEVK